MKLFVIYCIIVGLAVQNCFVGVLAGPHESSCEHASEPDGDEGTNGTSTHQKSTGSNYNLNLAITSVFVVGVVSFLGAGYPLLLAIKRHPWLIMGIKFGAFAGSGVMLSTGFVHMLFSANENLTSECLPESWLNRYGPWAFMFAVLTIILMQTLDYILFLFLYPTPEKEVEGGQTMSNGDVLHGTGPEGTDVDGVRHTANGLVIPDNAMDAMESNESDVSSGAECNKHVRCKDEECNSRVLLHTAPVTPKAKLLSNLIISEVSIGIHSLIIGITLGVTSSSEFVALFVAIIFHQLLEGVALGSNTAEAGVGFRVQLIFALIYSISTPIGIAIGIGVRQSLNTDSPAMLYTTGVLDAVAAGALIFLALGDHMNAVRTQATWLRMQKPIIQIACFFSFFAGAAILLVLAIWA